jgi:hemoglobin
MAGSLYERLGGKQAISAVIEDLGHRVLNDPRVNAKFAKSDVPRFHTMMVEQVCEATGGPCRYEGRDMKTAHTGMGVTNGEFDAVVDDLIQTLNHFGVGKEEQQELLGLLGPMRPDIVEDPSDATGTPLPEAYQPAPPLSG